MRLLPAEFECGIRAPAFTILLFLIPTLLEGHIYRFYCVINTLRSDFMGHNGTIL